MSRFLVGDCRDTLLELPEASVQCVITSVPYWSLRDYGNPPTVWGGDPECEHVWAEERMRGITGGRDRSTLGDEHWGNGKSDASIERTVARSETSVEWAWCQRCGAWLGDLGLEPVPELYVDHIVEVFRSIWRVLRDDGCVWLNIGDTYANDAKGPRGGETSGLTSAGGWQQEATPPGRQKGYRGSTWNIKRKDLCLIPARVAIALQEFGWYIRRDGIWAKGASFGPYHGNPMPESCRDRPSTSHEYLWLLTKRHRYFYDQEAVKEDVAGTAKDRGRGVNPKAKPPGKTPSGWDRGKGNHRGKRGRYTEKQNAHFQVGTRHQVKKRNLRSVWTIGTVPYGGAHSATFPPHLVEPMVKAGTSEVGACPACGAPWRRILRKGEKVRHQNGKPYRKDSSRLKAKETPTTRNRPHGETSSLLTGYSHEKVTVGWKMGCTCDYATPVPCVVLDPFAGTGVTGMVAESLGRSAILCEINPESVALAEERIAKGYDPEKRRLKRARERQRSRLQMELDMNLGEW